MPKILENEALALAQGIESLPPDQQAQAADVLRRYREQQHDLGEPDWPSQEQAAQESEGRFRALFDDLKNVDNQSPSFTQGLRFSTDPDADRARVAGTAFLSRVYQKQPEEVSRMFPLLRDDYLNKRGQKTGLDDRAFYSFAQGEVKRMTAREKAALEGAKAALRGEDSGKALAAWQAANPDFGKEDSGFFSSGFNKAMEEDGDSLPVAANLLSLLESGSFKSKDGKAVSTPFTDEQAAQLGGMVEQLAGMKPRQRKSIYRAMNARIEAAGYDQKGFWAQMLSELDRGLYRASTTLGTQAGILSDVMTAQANASQRSVDFSMDGGGGFSTPVLSVDEQQQLQRQRDFREQVGNVQAELQDIVAGRLDPVKPTVSWLNDTLETGMIKGPGAVAPFMAASAALGPWGAGILFTADFAEQNRRDLVGMGMDADQARQIGAAAAPAQAAVESLSNLFQLGRFPAVSAALARFTKPVGGASLVGRYVQNSLLAGVTEFTEEQIQDNFIVPASQELLAALNSDMPGVDWSFYKERAIQATPELAATLLPMALVFGGVMTAADAKLSAQMTGNIDALTALNFSQAQATEIVSQKTTEERIAKAASLWRSRAGNKASLEEGAKNLSAKLRELSSDTLKHQQELERRGILPRMLHAQDDSWLLTYNDGSTASFATHGEASKARWNWAEDQLGRMHALTREALTSMERNMSAGRELAVEFKPDARTAQDVVNEGAGMDQVLRRVEQGKALGDVPVEESFDNASAFDQATQDAEGFLSSLQILGSSRNEFKDGILRTTIKLWEGSNVLTLVEEKLEGDAKAILQSSTGRAWMLGVLRNYEQESGDKLFRDVADTGITNDDLAEAWSHLGQSYLVGRSSFGEPLQQNNMRRFSKLLMRAGLAGAINAESTFWQAVVNRAQKLGELKKAGKLGEDLAAELERQLGIDSQVVHEQGAIKEAQQVAQDVAHQVDTSGYSEANPGPNGETFSLDRAGAGGALHALSDRFYKGGQFMPPPDSLGSRKAKKELQKFEAFKSPDMVAPLRAGDKWMIRVVPLYSGEWAKRPVVVAKFDNESDAIDALHEAQFQLNERLGIPRAIPADASKVVQMPDGARLVGPTTFSIRAFHGTPHKVDKFKTAKIGTGEGAQAYGWGLYFAENEAVAAEYRQKLSSPVDKAVRGDGAVTVSRDYVVALAQYAIGEAMGKTKEESIARAMRMAPNLGLSIDETELARLVDAGTKWQREIGGNLYTVELLPDESDFLDWDKPLSEQSEKVKAALAELPEFPTDQTMTAAQAYREFAAPTQMSAFQGYDAQSAEIASRLLNNVGIPGIRYLDGGSRGAGDGTRNYVIFDENLVRILEENGKPVAQEPEQEPEPGELAPDSPVEDLPLEGDDIPWTEETFSIAPRVLPEVFPAFNEQIKNEIAAQTKTIAAIHIDRMKVGEFAGVPLQGGFFYPAIVDNLNKGVVWAFNADNIARGVANRAAANGGFIKLVLMQEGNVVGNKTFGTIWFKLLDEAIAAKRISKTAALTELNRVRAKFATHPDSNLRTDHVKTWKSVDEAREAIIGMPQKKRGATYFQKSKTVTKSQGVKIAYQSLLSQAMTEMGFPDAAAIVESIEEPSFKGVPTGAVVGIIKIDPLSESQKVMTATEAGVPEHLSYKYVLHGKPVARMTKFKVIDETFPETKNKLLSQQHTNFPLEPAFAETFSLRVTPENPIANEINGVAAKDIFASAKQKFGITRSVYEAGYVLPDGAMLDFSGRSQTSDFKQGADLVFRPVGGRDWMKDQRGIDHREIEWGGMPDYSEQWGAMVDFLRLGAVRVDGNSGMISMHSRAKITAAQASALKAIVVAADGAYLDLEDDAGNRASMSLESGKWGKVQGLLNRWASGETPEYTGTTFSLHPGDFASRVEAMFSPFQRSPEARLVMARVAKDRALRLGNELIDKANVIRTIGSIDREARVRAALVQDKAVQDYLDSLTPAARQTLEWEPSDLKDDPLVSAMLDFGKLMSKTTALQRGKVDLKMGDFDGAPWLPPSFYSKGSGIMPDQMAQAMFDAGLLPDAYTDTLWAELGKRIEASRKDKTAHREAVQAFKDAKKAASQKATQEAQAWADSTKKQAGSGKAQRDRIKAWLRVLDGILAAAPPEVRARVGGFVKMAGIATDDAALRYLEDRVAKLDKELDKWLKKEGLKSLDKLFKKAAADYTAGKKAKGKIGPDEHYLLQRAEAASEMDASTLVGELAKLDALATDDNLTAEQQAMAELERGILELVGNIREADAGRIFSAFDALSGIYQRGVMEWKAKQIARREQREAVRSELKADTGKTGTGKERRETEERMATGFGKLKSGWLSVSSFSEVLRYAFGAKSAQATALIDAEREASNTYEDEQQAIAEELEALFTDMAGTGKVLDGEKLRYDMAQRTIEAGDLKLSQFEAVSALLMWRQEDGRRHMEGTFDENNKRTSSWGYDQAWVDEVEKQLTPEGRKVMAFLAAKYGSEHAELNALYRERHGVNLPQHDNYAPILVKPMQTKAGEMVDPVSGAAVSGSILTPGSLRTRSRNAIAEPDFRDALQTFIAHKKQMGYWKAYYDLAVEAQAVLGNRELMNSVEAKAGKEAVSVIRKWLDVFAQGGVRDAAAGLAVTKWLGNMTNRAATVGLLGRVTTLLVQSTQLAAASVKMPVGAYLKRFGKLLAGQLDWSGAINSDFIQRRIKSAPPIVRQAMEGLGTATKPNQVKRLVRSLGNLLSGADGLFTGGTYAILLDYHREQGATLGLKGAELEEYAHTEAERATEEVAQPTRTGNRSLAELTATNPLAKVGWAYASEARQKVALFGWALESGDKTQAAKVAFLVFGIGGVLSQVLKNLWKEARGDDDEKMWSAGRLATAAMSPITAGIPGFSLLFGDGNMFQSVKWAPAAVKDIATGEGDLRDVNTVLAALGLLNDTAAGVAALSNAGLDFAKLVEHLFSGQTASE